MQSTGVTRSRDGIGRIDTDHGGWGGGEGGLNTRIEGSQARTPFQFGQGEVRALGGRRAAEMDAKITDAGLG